MELETGDVVLCTVDRIVGTTVFVHIDSVGKDLEGSLVFSEVASGRIRNIRDYVFPKKKIVCKVLRISGNHIDLSLRRVTLKEQKEIKERYKKERSFISMLNTILKDKAQKVLEEITKEETLSDFMQEAKENPKKLENLVGKTDAKKILDILKTEKQKKTIIRKEISLKSNDSNGLDEIKNLFSDLKDITVTYIAAGKYSLKKEAIDLKQADQELRTAIEMIEKKAKKEDMDFSILKK